MKALYHIIALSLLMMQPLAAQWDGKTIDPEAKKIVDKLKKKYAKYQSLEAEFDLTIELPESDTEVQKGRVGQSGDKYFLVLDNQEIYSDGESVWVYLKDIQEVQWNNAETDEEDNFLSPKDMLQIYESDDLIYAITETHQEKGVPYTTIEFKPKSLDSEYSKMRLVVNTDSYQMASLKVFAKDGSRFTLKINNITPGKQFAATDFVFDPKAHPGVYVEDLRID